MNTGAAAAKLETQTVHLVPIGLVDESPTNPRKTFHAIDELAENMRQRGQLQAVMVRPKGARFELVFGARRFRAAKVAKLETLAAVVREDLDDKAVIEIQLIENAKREDISPLEEADGYHDLVKVHGYSAETIAAKVNKSLRTIYERLQLCKLGKEGRVALAEGRLHASVATRIACIPAELQPTAVEELAARDEHDSPASYRAAVDHIQKNFMLQLKDAPFDVTDGKLMPKAGACSVCPKRTGNQRELFAEIKSADVCTDPKCHQGKVDALWQIKVATAEKGGQKVLSAAETKKVFPYSHTDTPSYDSPYKALDEQEYVSGKMRTVKQLLGKDAPAPVLARTPSGKLVELVPRDLVQKKLREAEPARPTSRGSDDYKEQERKRTEKHRLRREAVAAAMPKIVTQAEKSAANVWRFLAETVINGGGYHGALTDVAKRRELITSSSRPEDLLMPAIAKMKDEQLRAFVVEVLATMDATGGSYSDKYSDTFEAACRMFGVDLKKLEATENDRRQAAKQKKKGKGGAVCAVPGCGDAVKGKGFCEEHTKKLSATEQKSILDRNKRLAAEGKSAAPTQRIVKLPAKKKGGGKK